MDQKQIERLTEDGIWDGRPIRGVLKQTHISWLILVENYVFKIKRPVSLSFLDFSTLDKRRHFCHREVELNSRLTDIYLDVVPIRERGDGFEIGGEGPHVIDYAVRMKRLDSDREMLALLEAGRVTDRQIRQLAARLASFHREAARIEAPFSIDEMKARFNDIRSVSDRIAKRLGEDWTEAIERSIESSSRFLETHRRHIEERSRLGFRRDLHGDFHCSNVFLFDEPVIFDCIEFNDEMRQVDLLDEVAFFCMDLEARGRGDLSSQFLAEYQREMSLKLTDMEAMLFGYYKRYRANVRAKVSAMKETFDEAQVRAFLRLIRG